ncbi:MarR family winged helix-turn-helix transcriptional regulator [Deinococcus radiophilus]|uniref:MarR family transcriptional regulator n=1 Tax=Deinococcus radiophilus TaxID=32062 RepID=A0A3S0IAF9_9DEIO|nr:MarR family transcriptional regulator [Deinococcus radiophilus]RTR28981.1 MarR family transcriptional regulator [Deinococcus radiophilus]UFA49564.1 MarR family transcriptional regulator [Deinococcus radiophilus]
MKTRPLLERIDRDWRTRRPDLDPTPMRRLILLARTARAAAERIEAGQGRHGLNSAQADLLLTLYRSAPPEGLTPGQLTGLSAISPSSVTNRLDRLAAEGLIKRLPDPADARVRRVQLAEAGRQRVEQLLPDHLAGERALLSALTEAEQAELEQLLLRLLDRLEAGAD